MKTFIYSKYTKLIACVLIIVMFVLAMNSTLSAVDKLYTEEEIIYDFEGSFELSGLFDYMLYEPEWTVVSVYNDFALKAKENMTSSSILTVDGMTFHEYLEKQLKLNMYDHVDYYISIDGVVFTNCDAMSKDEICDSEFYYSSGVTNGEIYYDCSSVLFDNHSWLKNIDFDYIGDPEIHIASNISPDYVDECRDAWSRQEKIVRDGFFNALVCIVVAFLMFVYLISVVGKNKYGETLPIWIDNIWSEVHIGVIIGSGIGITGLCVWLFEAYQNNDGFPYYLFQVILLGGTALGILLILTSGLSLIRKIKCKSFVKTSFICLVIIWTFKIAFSVFRFIVSKSRKIIKAIVSLMSAKTGVILGVLMLLYTAIIGFCGVLLQETPIALFIALIFFGIAFTYIGLRSQDIDEIKNGASKIRSGELEYKIPNCRCEDMKELAENINDIGEGLNESVSAKLKAERMKSELITNVSHDLKTPLTSIINYTELLSKVDELPEEAEDYVRIIAQKSDRLKNLTQDLFDISKVQSGNEMVDLERLDISLLINQALGEQDNEIKSSGLKFCVDVEKEIFIMADGRKMSRVINNLISNALKYTMKNTRVFVSARNKDGMATIEFKNISSYPMDFDGEAIIGRFVRGDEARSTEGNGLGLAIVKNYVEICGGSFEVIVDGDLFKAIIVFSAKE